MIKLLLEKGTNITAKDHYRVMLLHEVARHGHKATVWLLLVRDDVEVNSKDIIGWTPLSSAAKYGHEAMVNLLLARDDIEVACIIRHHCHLQPKAGMRWW